MTHPAQGWIDAAAKKRKRGGGVEGCARGGSVNRPGKAKKRVYVNNDMDAIHEKDTNDKRSWAYPDVQHGGSAKFLNADDVPKARGGKITIKPSHKGLLHKELGVPQGESIPTSKMEKAKTAAGPAERKRITFAENAKKWGKD